MGVGVEGCRLSVKREAQVAAQKAPLRGRAEHEGAVGLPRGERVVALGAESCSIFFRGGGGAVGLVVRWFGGCWLVGWWWFCWLAVFFFVGFWIMVLAFWLLVFGFCFSGAGLVSVRVLVTSLLSFSCSCSF